MQSNFPACLDFTLRYEGGKVDDPHDPGGRTNQGVTQATYDAFRKARGLPKSDVYLMAASERDAIYTSGYWDKVGGSILPSGVDLAAFDYGVNSGPARAIKAIPKGLEPDASVKKICETRTSFLRGLSTYARYGNGWAKRVAACEALGVTMAVKALGVSKTVVQTELEGHAESAASKAKSTKTAAKTAAASTVAAPASATAHLPREVSLIILVIALAVAGYFAWRAMHNKARADAYAEAAKT